MIKKATDTYLVDALSFTEAEARIIKEVAPYVSGEFTVANIKRAKITELFEDETGDKWYRAKVLFVTLDEKSATEKKTACSMLIQAGDIREAISNLDRGMKSSMADYEVAQIAETPIIDIFKFNADDIPTKVDKPEYEQ